MCTHMCRNLAWYHSWNRRMFYKIKTFLYHTYISCTYIHTHTHTHTWLCNLQLLHEMTYRTHRKPVKYCVSYFGCDAVVMCLWCSSDVVVKWLWSGCDKKLNVSHDTYTKTNCVTCVIEGKFSHNQSVHEKILHINIVRHYYSSNSRRLREFQGSNFHHWTMSHK